ncbi:MAG: ammonium transporter [Alphaproteobacteria bacterium]|nr:ammonium transporter [Alphaproteobacteria bacterium]
MRTRELWLTVLLAAAADPAWAADAAALNGADTAWLLTATALVLFMTMPGLALFYGGLVRMRHVLSVLMHCLAIASVVSLAWLAVGYSLAFTADQSGLGLIGGLERAFLSEVARDTLKGTVPESLFFMFQLTFAVITPALIVGAYPERIRFSAVLVVSLLWLLVVYVPVCHWVWGGGWLAKLGVIDFAGGIVVHTTAGVSALVLAGLLGPRRGFPREVRPPHSPGLTVLGAGMLWVGWFGFNGGSALTADGNAAMAITVTHIAASAGAIAWAAMEWLRFGRPSVVGTATGLIAGLATITPAAGAVGPAAAIAIGLLAGLLCQVMTTLVKQQWRIDDTLDVFAVHGVGGILGSLLTGLFAALVLGGVGYAEGQNMLGQLGVQALGVGVVALWSALATFFCAKAAAALGGLRAPEEAEIEGLDLVAHGERGYDLR